MKLKHLLSTLVIAITLTATSCTITKTPVAGYQGAPGKEYTYAKAKQIHLFWGLVPLGYQSTSTPPDGVCEVITRKTLGDCLVTTLTAGIVVTTTIKVKAKKVE